MNAVTASVKTETILQKKIDDLIARSQTRCQSAIAKIEQDTNEIEDTLVNLNKAGLFRADDEGIFLEYGDSEYLMSDYAIGQMSDKFRIPTRYMRELQGFDWGVEFAAEVLNKHRSHDDRSFLVRSVDSKVRGVLSDRYRRMETSKVYSTFISMASEVGGKFYRADWSEQKVHMKCIIPQIRAIKTKNNGEVHAVFGVRLVNSDFGASALAIQTFMLNAVCENGMTSSNQLRHVHVGAQMSDLYSQKTFDLYTEAATSGIGDVISETLSPASIDRYCNNICEASEVIIEPEKALRKLAAVGCHKSEVESVGNALMANNHSDGVQGASTMWKLSQALTAVARDMDNDRKFVLEDYAGKLVSLEA